MNRFVSLLESISVRVTPVQKDIYLSFNAWLVLIGSISLYSYALLKLPAIDVSRVLFGIMLLAFFVSVTKAPLKAKWDPAWRFVVAAIVISLFIYFWSNALFPDYAEEHPYVDNLLNLCLFFPVAWWLGGQTRSVLWLLSAAIIGFGVNLVLYGNWVDVINGLSGKRVDFNMRNAQHTATFFSVAFLGWVILVKRVIGNGGRASSISRAIVWIAVTIILGFGTVITQTRAVWIGVVAAFLVVAPFILLHLRYQLRYVLFGLCAAILVATAVIYPLSDTITNRMKHETVVVNQLFSDKADTVPYSSIGIRVHTWIEAWQWIKQRPITGWGYTARGKVFDDSTTLPPWVIKQFRHFHNSYIEILLSYGVIGALYILFLFLYVAKEVWRAWRLGTIPTDIFLFGVAFSVYWMLVNLTESYFIWSTGVYLMALIGGCLYTYPLSERQRLNHSSEQVHL